MKRVNINMMIVSSLLVFMLALSGCGSAPEEKNDPEAYKETVLNDETFTPNGESDLRSFTEEELMKYDGKNGNPAYIVVDGKVYDVTNAPNWNTGGHNGVSAGRDLTKEMKNAPHGLSKLELVKVVGVLK
ncbi:MAG TPA: cytochrome b5 domain-containing protein [Pseudobacteroides sp.]|uniref:cytochrome b5 domain-containing protein n=1 Tax=Pseudobacteroides sp. TaxID=1968840 RepID=UPI002F94309F